MGRVAIVGAGPAGATLAYLLARRGVDVALLERHSDFAREFRGEVLMPSGLLPFREMGLWDVIERVPHVTFRGVALYVNGDLAARPDFDPDLFGEPPRWMSQPALLEGLVDAAAPFPSFTFERGVGARGLLRDGDRYAGVRVLDGGHEREVRADLTIGTDGRSSLVRRRADLPVHTDPAPMDIVWCKLPMHDGMKAEQRLRAYVGAGHLLLVAPIYDNHLQIAWIIAKGSFGEIKQRGMQECLCEMARFVSPDLAEHFFAHQHDATEPFLLSTVSDHVERWSEPGLLVLGDAAHTMSPVGAQGINVAIRDAVVAANHLVPVLTTGAALDLRALDEACRRIEAERRPEIEEIQKIQALPPRILLRDTWWSRLALRILPRLLGRDIARARGGAVFRRFAFGTTDVALRV